ncbi:hypothetical protein pb186bvf_018906 [Paramecium bursaria]
MLQKFLDQKKKEGEQASQNETDDQRLKRLMLEKKKNRNQEAKLPKEAQLVDGLLQVDQQINQCTVCGQVCDVIVEFNKHLKLQRHQSILQQQEDKRKAIVDAQLLEIESQKITTQKQKQKLTKDVIERINKEVEEEFKNVIIQEQQQVPQNFFEKMEQEFFVSKQQQEIEIQIEDDRQSDVDIEELKANIGKKNNTQEIEKMLEQKYAVSDDDEEYQDWRQV